MLASLPLLLTPPRGPLPSDATQSACQPGGPSTGLPGTKRGLGLGTRGTFVLAVAFWGHRLVDGGAVGGLGRGHVLPGWAASRSLSPARPARHTARWTPASPTHPTDALISADS